MLSASHALLPMWQSVWPDATWHVAPDGVVPNCKMHAVADALYAP
jgi:hypothetical protein